MNPEDPDFFFVQVGANDGLADDPIQTLIRRYHWKGILLEPQPTAYKDLLVNYHGEDQPVIENAALAPADRTMTLWTIPGSSGLATFDQSLAHSYAKLGEPIDISVKAISVPSLLAKYQIKDIDLLQVDTEGYDFEVIKMFLTEASVRPKLINYEYIHLSTKDRRACIELLGRLGYKMIRAGAEGNDTIAYLPS